MATLKVASALLLAAAPWPAEARDLGRFEPLIAQAAERFSLPPAWIREVMRAESGGRLTIDGRPTTSRAGAMGLMQLMPGTWAEMRQVYRLGPNPYEPRDNILAGTAYLRAMYDRFGYPGMFAAYNAGPSRYAGHAGSGRGLPAETISYVAKVMGAGANLPGVVQRATWRIAQRPAQPALFAVRRDRPAIGREGGVGAGERTLFAIAAIETIGR